MEKFVAISLAPEGLLSNSSLLHTAHSTHRLLAYRAPCAATTSPAQAAGKCGHHDYGSQLCLVFSTKCECYVVVGNANVSATTDLGSTNNLKNHFISCSFPTTYSAVWSHIPVCTQCIRWIQFDTHKKKRSHSPR